MKLDSTDAWVLFDQLCFDCFKFLIVKAREVAIEVGSLLEDSTVLDNEQLM